MIRLRNIRKSFTRPDQGRLEVLKGIDCDIPAGEFVAVVGPSGSGKSTLMNILGLLDQPDEGEYALGGETVSGLDSTARARIRNRKIGFVFQQFHLLARTTATENVELPLMYSTETDIDIGRKAREALCRVGLEERLTHYPSELSGGQQQRVAIARALVNRPGVILADEPTGNLDRESGARIMDLFRDLNRNGATILLITHDETVASCASRVVRIADGQVVDAMARKAS